ncbi:MAG TPA: amidohydrolase family protein [Chloroflexota bacterium]|jgi:imidazolonepropionase-like amidohydrolase|nr:amidohydrolase family protein [Chloroflexota bacterium]
MLLRNCTLIDVVAQRHLPHAALLIEHDRITAIGRTADFPAAEPTVDLAGRYIAPGFIDPHVHLAFSAAADALDVLGDALVERAAANARTALRAGVTTLADCGSPGRLGLEFQKLSAPRVLVSLQPITLPGGHCHHFGALASGIQQLTTTANQLLDDGADFLKIIASGGGTSGATPPWEPQYTAVELRAVVDIGHARGRRVVAHCRAPAAIRAAVAAGIDRLEHLTWDTPSGVAYEPALAKEMAAQGTWADPTLPAGYRAARSNDIPLERRHELERHFGQRYPAYRRLTQEAGVRLLCGTDAGTPFVTFDDFALAPELLVDVAGYTPVQALTAATLWAAESLGLAADRGSLDVGKLADLVVLGQDPLTSVAALRRVEAVMVGGVWAIEPTRQVRNGVHV